MGIPPAGGRYGGGGTAGGEDLLLPPPEHIHTVYFYHAHYGTVTGGRAEARVKGDQAAVGAGRIECGGDAGGGLVGGTDGGGGEDGRDRDGYRLSRWKDNVTQSTLETDTNDPLAYAMGLEHNHPITSTLGDPEGRLETERGRGSMKVISTEKFTIPERYTF